jgi:hypothetical protein
LKTPIWGLLSNMQTTRFLFMVGFSWQMSPKDLTPCWRLMYLTNWVWASHSYCCLNSWPM